MNILRVHLAFSGRQRFSLRPRAAAGRRRRPVRLRRGRRRYGDLAGRVRPAHRAREERLQGGQAGVPEGGHTRVPEPEDAVRGDSRPARGVRQAADDLGIEVTDADVDKAERRAREVAVRRQVRGVREGVEGARPTPSGLAQDWASGISVVSQKLFDEVTKDVEVTDQDMLASYTQNQAQYGTPESRDVRHILIAEKDADGQVDFEKSKAEADGSTRSSLAAPTSPSWRRRTRRTRQQEHRRQAHDLARSDRARVRQDVVRAG